MFLYIYCLGNLAVVQDTGVEAVTAAAANTGVAPQIAREANQKIAKMSEIEEIVTKEETGIEIGNGNESGSGNAPIAALIVATAIGIVTGVEVKTENEASRRTVEADQKIKKIGNNKQKQFHFKIF